MKMEIKNNNTTKIIYPIYIIGNRINLITLLIQKYFLSYFLSIRENFQFLQLNDKEQKQRQKAELSLRLLCQSISIKKEQYEETKKQIRRLNSVKLKKLSQSKYP